MSGGRYLIAIGSPECPKLDLPPLRRVSSDIERIERLFTSPAQGYERVLGAELPIGSGAATIGDAVAGWFAAEERQESDCVVVYFAGHGDPGIRFQEHCLLTADSDPRRSNTI